MKIKENKEISLEQQVKELTNKFQAQAQLLKEMQEFLNQIKIRKDVIARYMQTAPRISAYNTGAGQVKKNIDGIWEVIKLGFLKDFFKEEDKE